MGGRAAAFTAFIVAALTITLLMGGLATVIGTAQTRVVKALKASTYQVRWWGGWILILVGIWLIVLAIGAGFFARFLPV